MDYSHGSLVTSDDPQHDGISGERFRRGRSTGSSVWLHKKTISEGIAVKLKSGIAFPFSGLEFLGRTLHLRI